MPALCGFFSASPPGRARWSALTSCSIKDGPGVTVSPDSVYQAVAALRRLLGDDPKQATYIAAAPRLGYQMVAPVEQWKESSTPIALLEASAPSPVRYHKLAFAKIAAVVLCIILGTGLFLSLRSKIHCNENGSTSASAAVATPPQKSIAVLPFLDLTEGMKQGEFADGMTEELIDKSLSALFVPTTDTSSGPRPMIVPSMASSGFKTTLPTRRREHSKQLSKDKVRSHKLNTHQ